MEGYDGNNRDMTITEDDNKEEQDHWDDVCNAYRQYATFALCHWTNQCRRLENLSTDHRQFLPQGLKSGTEEFNRRSELFKDAAIRNQFCLDCILRHAGKPHSQQATTANTFVADGLVSKVSSVLKSLARDWSEDGKAERDMAYEPILKAITKHVPINPTKKDAPRICVPGAGVGRLALEITALGYRVQGNEFSLFMLLASDFVLNNTNPERPIQISPWLLESRNSHSSSDPIRIVSIPDVHPNSYFQSENEEPDFSMAAGDFCSIYSHARQAGRWDAVASCFFLDTAPNIVEYIRVIYNMLKVGGALINFGPLLYHWSGPALRPDDRSYEDRFSHLDRRYMTSMDLSWEDVRHIILNVGFDLVEEKIGIPALYTADRRSMMNMSYRCIHFVAIKYDHNQKEEVEICLPCADCG